MAQAPLDRSLARPTDAPPLAHAGADGSAEPSDVRRATRGRPTRDASAALPPEELPRHVAIIMDGNRRWARARGKPDFEGHAAGVEAIRELLRHAVRRGVPMLTLYAFSRENWARSDEEVAGLFELLGQAIRDETDELARPGRARSASSAGSRSCPTRREPRSAPRSIARPRAPGSSSTSPGTTRAGPRSSTPSAASPPPARRPTQVDERTISEALYTGGLPDPDLVIRTGGEQRISNFLIWQSAYAELVFSERLWPDFGPDAFDEALLEFASRTRRFGR